jgi:hypothetical protein
VSMCVVSGDVGSGDAAGICLRGREIHSVCCLHAALLSSIYPHQSYTLYYFLLFDFFYYV